jgi:hypothetical protein
MFTKCRDMQNPPLCMQNTPACPTFIFNFAPAGSRSGDCAAIRRWLKFSRNYQRRKHSAEDAILHRALKAASEDWLRAIFEPKIGAALRSIHELVNSPWTVESLAAAAAL